MPFTCPASEARAQLKHTFLENTLLVLSEPLLRLHLQENRQFEESMATISSTIINRLEDDFNPAFLIDRIDALASLPEGLRTVLRQKLRKKYYESFEPVERVQRLKGAWDRLEQALRIWKEAALNGEETSTAAFEQLRSRVREYHAEVAALPRGIWTA